MEGIVSVVEKLLNSEYIYLYLGVVMGYVLADSALILVYGQNLYKRITLSLGEILIVGWLFELLPALFPAHSVVILESISIVLFFILLFLVSAVGGAGVKKIYRHAASYYWRRRYDLTVRKDSGLDREEFRSLTLLSQRVKRREFFQDLPGTILVYFQKALRVLVSISGSDQLDDIQYRLGRYICLIQLRGRIDTEGEEKGKNYWVHVKLCEWSQGYIFIHITYYNTQSKTVKSLMQWKISRYLGVDRKEVIMQQIAKGHIKAIVEMR